MLNFVFAQVFLKTMKRKIVARLNSAVTEKNKNLCVPRESLLGIIQDQEGQMARAFLQLVRATPCHLSQTVGCRMTDTQCASTAGAQLINKTAVSDGMLYFQLEQQSSSLDPSPASHLPSATPEWPCLLGCTPMYLTPLCLPGPVPMPNAYHCCPAALSAPSVWCALRPKAQLSPAHLLGLLGRDG